MFTGTVTLAADPTTNLEAATKQYVDRLVAGINDFTVGVVDSSTPLPATDYKVGQTFRVAEAGTYAGVECEAGDLIIVIKDYAADGASNSDFLVVQAKTVLLLALTLLLMLISLSLMVLLVARLKTLL